MSAPATTSLKRPRSSNPSSPSTSSSSKRALSEGPSASSESVKTEGPSVPASSTLLSGLGSSSSNATVKMEENDDVGWVQKTEDFHLNSDSGHVTEGDVDEDEGAKGNEWIKVYSEILRGISPPFVPWQSYYLIPVSFLDNIKKLAHLEHSASALEEISFKLDLSSLLKSPDSESVYLVLHNPADNSPFDPLTVPRQAVDEPFWHVKDGLVENEDFMFISDEGWEEIVGAASYKGPELRRICLPGERIEMVPPIYTLHIVRRPSGAPDAATEPKSDVKPIRFTCPTATPLGLLNDAARFFARTDTSQTRLWSIQTSPDSDSLPALDSRDLPASLLPSLSSGLLDTQKKITCAEAGLDNGDHLVIEIGKSSPLGGTMWAVDVNEQGKAAELGGSTIPVPTAPPPLFSKPAFYGGSGNSEASSSKLPEEKSGMQTRSQAIKKGRKGKGLVGLVNLGNTCFMNSAVQCLSNTVELKDYFFSGVYKSELNKDNPLGMHGQMAESFGQVIEQLWASASASSSLSPRQLKYTTSRFAPQFAGYGQHDTQEFIAFLLDGLHEDLNRIQKKPYIEKPDWKPGGGDQELAELGKECWDGYKKRNDSVIVDLFQGQLKSTLICPVCTKESITLDPFMYLTVPLPIAQTRIFKCFFVPLDPEQKPKAVRLLIPYNASFMQVKEKLGALVNCEAKHLVGFDLWKGGVYSWWLDSGHNSECKDSDEAIFYELAVPVNSNRKAVGYPASETTITVPVYTATSYGGAAEGVSQPFFITLTRAEVSDPVAVREAITRGYSRLIRSEMQSHMWTASGSSKAAVALPPFVAEEDEPVTEIHIDGDETRVVETTSRSNDTDAPSPIINSVKKMGSSTSLSTLGSVKSGKLVPRGDLFKVHVADAGTSESASSIPSVFKSKEDTIPFFKGGPSSAAGAWSILENRKKAKKNMFGHIATGLKSIVGGSYVSDDESSPTGTPVAPPLVVRPGEGIFCEWSVRRYQEFFDTTVKFDEEIIDPAIAKEAAKKKAGRSISLEDCLDEFSKEETLGQDDLWYCPQCKKHQAATKRLEIYQAPDILVICIKRFGSSRRLHDKLDNMVDFPIDGLDLTERIGERQVAKSLNLNEEQAAAFGMQTGDESMIYDLYAVDNHFGGLGGGHYTAFCKNEEDGEWYNYDDSRVSKSSPDAVQSRAAYLLFYRRRTTRPIGGISRLKAEEASRAASPLVSDSDEDQPRAATTIADSDELPSYSQSRDPPTPPTPPLPSPTLSSPSNDGPSGASSPRSTSSFGTGAGITSFPEQVGASIGFGNTAWGRRSGPVPHHLGDIHHAFGSTSQDATPSTVSLMSDSIHEPNSPPASDDDYERVEKHGIVGEARDGAISTDHEAEQGTGDFEMVDRAVHNEDTEMASSSKEV